MSKMIVSNVFNKIPTGLNSQPGQSTLMSCQIGSISSDIYTDALSERLI